MVVYEDNLITLHQGHVPDVLREMPAESVHCVVTSPPYWGLRDYGLEPQVWDDPGDCEHEWGDGIITHKGGKQKNEHGGQRVGRDFSAQNAVRDQSNGQFCRCCNAWKGSLGLEPTPELYIQHIAEVFREVRRVLRKDGTCWVNIGDSYASGKGDCFNPGGGDNSLGRHKKEAGAHPLSRGNVSDLRKSGLKPKDLCMIPARVALALQNDGWWLRSDIIWSKSNPMPESVTDRPTRSHEYVFLLTKSAKYFYDADAVREAHKEPWRSGKKESDNPHSGRLDDPNKEQAAFTVGQREYNPAGRNLRSVWTIPTQPFPQAHFATFPEKLASTCIKAGTSVKGCCPECGSPWTRIIDYKANYEKREPAHQPNNTPSKVDSTGWKQPKRETIGWEPTCKHYSAYAKKYGGDITPCTVLDPFAGSCRALIVAKKLGRRGIGIDLKGEYLDMPKKELSQEVMEF